MCSLFCSFLFWMFAADVPVFVCCLYVVLEYNVHLTEAIIWQYLALLLILLQEMIVFCLVPSLIYEKVRREAHL